MAEHIRACGATGSWRSGAPFPRVALQLPTIALLLVNSSNPETTRGGREHLRVPADDYWVSVGSTKFDNRSFRLNDEANLNVFDEEFARAQAGVFGEDRARSRKVTLEEWRRRPIGQRLQELVGRMMRHQL